MDGEHIFAAVLNLYTLRHKELGIAGADLRTVISDSLKQTKFIITELDHVEREVWETRVMKPSAAMVERRRSTNLGGGIYANDTHLPKEAGSGSSLDGPVTFKPHDDPAETRVENVDKEMRPFGLPDPKILMDQLAAKGQAILDAKKAATEEANAWRRVRTGPVPESGDYRIELNCGATKWVTSRFDAGCEPPKMAVYTGRWYGPVPGPVEG